MALQDPDPLKCLREDIQQQHDLLLQVLADQKQISAVQGQILEFQHKQTEEIKELRAAIGNMDRACMEIWSGQSSQIGAEAVNVYSKVGSDIINRPIVGATTRRIIHATDSIGMEGE